MTFGDDLAAVASSSVAKAGVTGYEIERELAAAGMATVAGVDEVGRGAWAGPVVVCAVVARPGYPVPPEYLTDSKKLTPKRRETLARELPDWVAAHAIGAASHEEIDAYVATGEPLGLAGAFSIDGLAAPFIEGIEGVPSNVLGVSLPVVRRMLHAVGVQITDLWTDPT